MSQKPKPNVPDPYFGLKYIAYCRTGLPVNDEDIDEQSIIQFAKWQICKARNVLWGDPIWDSYTSEEIMVEYLAIRFDESEEKRKEFEKLIVTVKAKDIDWMERQVAKHSALAKQGKIKEGEVSDPITKLPETPAPPVDFEDKF